MEKRKDETTTTASNIPMVYLSPEGATATLLAAVVANGMNAQESRRTWNDLAHYCARGYTLRAQGGLVEGTEGVTYRNTLSVFLSTGYVDKKDPARKVAQSSLSRAMKALREGTQASMYSWPPGVEKQADTQRDTLKAWTKTATPAAVAAVVAYLPAAEASALSARESALASLTAAQRAALGL